MDSDLLAPRGFVERSWFSALLLSLPLRIARVWTRAARWPGAAGRDAYPTRFRGTNPIGRKIHGFNLLGLEMVHMAGSVLSDGMDRMDEIGWCDQRALRFRETNPIGHRSDFGIVSYDLGFG